MKHTFMKGLAAAAVVTVALGACSSSGSPSSSSSGGSSSGSSSSAKTLVIDDTPLSPMTQTFSPYLSTSTGYVVQAIALYNEPLMIFNTLNPQQKPFMELATGYSWSADGKPFSAADVAFTFNMIKTSKGLTTDGTPVPESATAPDANTAVLKFDQPEFANLFLIGHTFIVPEHIWSKVNPATFTDPN